MIRRLMLLRHGKSDWNSGAARDFDRPLAPRGRKAVPKMAQWAQSNSCLPEMIVSSPAWRALETARLFAKHIRLPEQQLQTRECLYPGNGSTLLDMARASNEDTKALMLVGHNPGMDHALMMLCGLALPRTASGKLMTTATLAVIEFELESWAQLAAPAVLRWLIRPRDLQG